MMLVKRITPLLIIMFVFSLVSFWVTADYADARSRSGGRSFSSSRTYRTPTQSSPTSPYSTNRSGSFTRGLAGGFMGGALGSMLFGGMGGGFGGSGIGLLQILLFAGVGYFLYKRFFKPPSNMQQYQNVSGGGSFSMPGSPPTGAADRVTEGIALIRRSEPDFDPKYFKEVAQDVFFQVQAGWMRRDIGSYRHLLGEQLATEYEENFAEMRQKGHINKLENIAVRKVEVVDAGAEDNEEFIVVLFTANLLDYTVDEQSGDVVSGSNTDPVKFAEKWTWARPVGTQNWKLEGLEVVNG